MYINMYWCFDISINIYTCICTYSNIHNMTVPIVTEAPRFDRAAGALLRSQMQHVTMSHGLHLQGLKAGSVTYTSCACTYAYAFLCLQIHVTCMHVFFPLSLSLFLFMLCIHRFSRTMTWVSPKMWIQSQNSQISGGRGFTTNCWVPYQTKPPFVDVAREELWNWILALFGWTFSLKKDPTNETDCSGICVVEPWRQGYMQFLEPVKQR